MDFESKEDKLHSIGRYVGYLLIYIVFTTMLFFILYLKDVVSGWWNYLYVADCTFLGVIIIKIIRKKVFEA